MTMNLFLELKCFRHKLCANTLIAMIAWVTNVNRYVISAGSMGSQLAQLSSQVTELHYPLINLDQPIYTPHSIYQKNQMRFLLLLFTNICPDGHPSQLKGPFLCCARFTNA
jgi:hypothetical protein